MNNEVVTDVKTLFWLILVGIMIGVLLSSTARIWWEDRKNNDK